jgi:hypothetical protein
MSFFAFYLQIGELFRGNFNWQGVLHLTLFILMGAIVVGMAIYLGYQAFRPKK